MGTVAGSATMYPLLSCPPEDRFNNRPPPLLFRHRLPPGGLRSSARENIGKMDYVEPPTLPPMGARPNAIPIQNIGVARNSAFAVRHKNIATAILASTTGLS